MGIFKFYGLVLKEAVRHSPDLAQTIIFFLLLLSGLIANGNPSVKPLIESYDLGGWKVAALVFAATVAMRLFLAPYWLWKSAEARNVATPERSIDYKLSVATISCRTDIKAKAIQIIFVLHNASYFHSIQYEVEEVYAEVDGQAIESEIVWKNKGEIVPPTTKYNFDYPWIHLKSKKWIKPGTEGHVRIVYKYGAAGQPFGRRAYYAAPIVIEKNYIRANSTENREEAI